MPNTDSGKAIACRNATTHGLFSRDVVLPSLGEDPEEYKQLQAEWMAQLPPRTLLERHYVEKIAAASWRLRRLHCWQAQILEDPTLTEDERLGKMDKVLRHETTLHRQIDSSVKMLAKDAPQLYTQRARDAVLADTRTAEREYRDSLEDAVNVDLQTQDHLYRIRKATEAASEALAAAPVETRRAEICENELPPALAPAVPAPLGGTESLSARCSHLEFCENEPIFCENEPIPQEIHRTGVRAASLRPVAF